MPTIYLIDNQQDAQYADRRKWHKMARRCAILSHVLNVDDAEHQFGRRNFLVVNFANTLRDG